jgi:NADH:ubiquinone oxidoreductase subunit F (NADH-binding)
MSAARAPETAPPPELPRLLAGVHDGAPVSLEQHVARYGPLPRHGMRRRGSSALMAIVEQSGLRGRGGGAFPTARKMHAVAHGSGRPVVVVNGSEGEPLSAKDKLLLAMFPHLVLDGAAVAAEAVGASEVVIAVDRDARPALRAVAHALGTRGRARLDPVPFRLVDLPTRYVAGEETALVSFLNGADAKPTFVPPRPFERGVGGRPTLVQNVETLAHLALIARFGPDWFRSVGTDGEPGSVLLTVSGAVAHPGVCEVALGTSLRDVMAVVGGETHQISAFLVGGYFGSWMAANDVLDLPLTNATLRAAGSGLGCGVFYAFPAGRCGVEASARIARYLADESAGQCGPCLYGLRAVADSMQAIADCRHGRGEIETLRRWCNQIEGRGACSFPDGAVRFARSALEVFAEEVHLHGQRGRCLTGDAPAMPMPRRDANERSWR